MEKLGASIAEVAAATGESGWTVKNKLRQGIYQGKKSGRRTLITIESVHKAWADLPAAKYATLRPRKQLPESARTA
jgi:hypothetical protein